MEHAAGFENDRLTTALAQSAQGDSTAFAELVQQHQGMVFSIAYHFLHDRALAEDLAQEVFLELYQSLDRIESSAHLTYWLRRVTANRCIDLTTLSCGRLAATCSVTSRLTPITPAGTPPAGAP